jgi:hypothetical protein
MKEEFDAAYWNRTWGWYEKEGGFEAMMDFFLKRDLSKFDPKATPRQTEGFRVVVENALSPESAAVKDAIDNLGHPPILMWRDVKTKLIPPTTKTGGTNPMDNRRLIPSWMSDTGYRKLEGQWAIDKMDAYLYARDGLRQYDARIAAGAYKAAIEGGRHIPESKADKAAKAAKDNVFDFGKPKEK